MNSIRQTALAVMVAACATGAGFAQAADGDAWSLARIAARAIEADPAVRASGALAGIAATQYALELDKAQPKFALGLTPFSYDARRLFDFSAIDFPSFDIADAYVDLGTMSAGASLGYQQALPTAGAFSAGLKTSLGISDDAGTNAYALSPTLNASVRQPLFAGGEFLPFSAAAAARKSVSLSAEQAVLDDRGRRNQAVRLAVDTAGRVLVLRRTLAVQEASLTSALSRAESFSLRRSAGTATEDAALEFALTAELVRQALVDTRLALRDAERRLASTLGLEATPGGALALPELSAVVPALNAAGEPGLATASDAVRAALASDKARADAASRATIDAPVLGASIVASPRYPDARDDAGNLASLLSDFADTEGGAGFNWNLSITLDVPLSAGAGKEYRRRLDLLSIEVADAQRLQAERSVGDRAAALSGRRDALRERLTIQRRIAELDGRKAERAAELAAVGTIPAEDAVDARNELDRALAEVLRSELDLLLAELDLRALAGEDLAAVLAASR